MISKYLTKSEQNKIKEIELKIAEAKSAIEVQLFNEQIGLIMERIIIRQQYEEKIQRLQGVQIDAEVDIESIVNQFYEEPRIDSIYADINGANVGLYLSVDKEFDEMALTLARIQNAVAKKHPQLDIDIFYFPKEHASEEQLPDSVTAYPRR